ncbi:MAG: class I SAM-dependent methyltransferase [Candidatus Solibacter sp.]
MPNPFGTDEMAAGYARSRPPVHPRVIERAFIAMGRTVPFRRALDVGCGAGVSTRALEGFAIHRVGLEPAETMLRFAATVAPGAEFLAGVAEALPLGDLTVDLIAAAGSLNYVDLARFFAEASRILTADGVLLVYDFSAGRNFRHTAALDEWFAEFSVRYPPPPQEARALNPATLARAAVGFCLGAHENFEIALRLTPEFYLDYVLTETNVAAAVRRGVELAEICGWCADTLAPVWRGESHEVLFRGYYACLRPTAPGN